jgi:hypothetical protein
MKKISRKLTRRQRLEALAGLVNLLFARRRAQGRPVESLKSRAACISRAYIAEREAEELA